MPLIDTTTGPFMMQPPPSNEGTLGWLMRKWNETDPFGIGSPTAMVAPVGITPKLNHSMQIPFDFGKKGQTMIEDLAQKITNGLWSVSSFKPLTAERPVKGALSNYLITPTKKIIRISDHPPGGLLGQMADINIYYEGSPYESWVMRYKDPVLDPVPPHLPNYIIENFADEESLQKVFSVALQKVKAEAILRNPHFLEKYQRYISGR